MSSLELVSIDPATGETVWSGKAADAKSVDAVIKTARESQPAWEALTLQQRVEILRKYQNSVRDHSEALATMISRETGKPFWETKTEVTSVIGKVDISLTAYQERTGNQKREGEGFNQQLRHRPHGVLGVLGPYNFPAHLPNGHIVPALLAGNSVVFKPSELTPGTAEIMYDCWLEAGLPEGVLGLVQGSADAGKVLAGHDDLDGLLFTGSATTGHALARQYGAAPGKILALEMGGNNPLIAWDIHDDDLEAAAAIIVQSAYLSSGQRCSCARRLIVEDKHYDGLLHYVAELIDRLIVGAPFDDPQPFMGPVVSNMAADRLQEQFLNLVMRGGKAIKRLNRPDADKPFLTPALIDVTAVADRPDEEIFGPVLQLIRVADFDAALVEANATRFGLAAGLVGGDQTLYDRFWSGTRAGVVNWNRPTNGASSTAPFGGVGDSGNHRPSAYYASDYCAFPVASLESTRVRGTITMGLKAED